MHQLTAATVSVLGAIIGLAIVAVLVSKNAQTPNVIGSAGTALSSVIGAAVQPVTGGSSSGLGNTSGGLLGGNTSNLFGSMQGIINQGGIGGGLF